MIARGGAMAGMAAMAGLMVAGCSSEPERQAPSENIVEEATPSVPVDVPEEPEPAPLPPPEPAANLVDVLPADEPVAPDQQMLDDADASGLTARTVRSPDGAGDEPARPADEGAAEGNGGGARR